MAGGPIVLLNGAPRAGKSAIANAMQARDDGRAWVNFGVDAVMAMTPDRLQPGVGLRPGGEHPELEADVASTMRAWFAAVAAMSNAGAAVVVDCGIHDDYSAALGTHRMVGLALAGLPVLVVGVRCPVDEIMARRRRDPHGYDTGGAGTVPAPVLRWQAAVHDPGHYDLEVDTSLLAADECADVVLAALAGPHPAALHRWTEEIV